MAVYFEHSKHVELWTWLSENPHQSKEAWFEINGECTEVHNLCYACNYCEEDCEACPLEHPIGSYCLGGLYHQWESAQEDCYDKDASFYARQIANLPVREGVLTR